MGADRTTCRLQPLDGRLGYLGGGRQILAFPPEEGPGGTDLFTGEEGMVFQNYTI